MSETESVDAVERAVEADPAAVAAIVDRLDLVNELLDVVELVTGALDDDMVRSLAGLVTRLGELADTASDEDVARGLQTLLVAVGEASDPVVPVERVGPLGLLSAMRDPDVQRGMGYLLAVAKATGQAVERDRTGA